jgi:PIN domain nuclease of toxin-antitoxin system
MRLLLDTHLLVWAMGSPQRLPAGLAPMLEDPAHTPVFSVASLHGAASSSAPSPARGGWQELSIEAHHALAVAALPPLHRDPFDRLLLAQASAEGLLLITADHQLARYPAPVRLMPA